MFFKRARHELNKIHCIVKNDCIVGKAGTIHIISAGFARNNAKNVLIIPPLRKLKQHLQTYTLLGYPIDVILPYMEKQRREHVKLLGKVVPQWNRLSQKYEKEDAENLNK